MKRRTSLLAALLALVLVVASCGNGNDDDANGNGNGNGLTVSGDANGAPGDPGFLSVFVPTDLARPVETLLDAFKEDEPSILFQITTGPRDQLQEQLDGDNAPNIYIDTPEAVDDLDVETAGDPMTLGTDTFQIGVARDNPAGVPGLEAFAGGNEWTTGLCVTEVPCGELGRTILSDAGVDPAPEVETDSGRALASLVADGEVDAGLMLRTQLRTRFFRTEAIPVPTDVDITIEYSMVEVEAGDATARFVAFLESPEGDETLKRVGLRSFQD